MAADISELFGDSKVLQFLFRLASQALPLAVYFVVIALATALFYYREKYINLQNNLHSMAKTARDLLDARFKGTHMKLERFFNNYTILNGEGDCRFSIRASIRASTDTPIKELEVYEDGRGLSKYEDFANSLKGDGVEAVPIEELRIGGERFFVYKLVFPRSIDQNAVCEYGVNFTLKGYYPLGKGLNVLEYQIAVPTERTGCRVVLPEGWELASRSAKCDKQLLEDKHFHEIDGEGFEWLFEKPKRHSFYNIYFSAKQT